MQIHSCDLLNKDALIYAYVHLLLRLMCESKYYHFFSQLQKDTNRHKQAFCSEHMTTCDNLYHLTDINRICVWLSCPFYLVTSDHYISAIFSIDIPILIEIKIEVNMALSVLY